MLVTANAVLKKPESLDTYRAIVIIFFRRRVSNPGGETFLVSDPPPCRAGGGVAFLRRTHAFFDALLRVSSFDRIGENVFPVEP